MWRENLNAKTLDFQSVLLYNTQDYRNLGSVKMFYTSTRDNSVKVTASKAITDGISKLQFVSAI